MFLQKERRKESKKKREYGIEIASREEKRNKEPLGISD
jgi:hypothetical protein